MFVDIRLMARDETVMKHAIVVVLNVSLLGCDPTTNACLQVRETMSESCVVATLGDLAETWYRPVPGRFPTESLFSTSMTAPGGYTSAKSARASRKLRFHPPSGIVLPSFSRRVERQRSMWSTAVIETKELGGAAMWATPDRRAAGSLAWVGLRPWADRGWNAGCGTIPTGQLVSARASLCSAVKAPLLALLS